MTKEFDVAPLGNKAIGPDDELELGPNAAWVMDIQDERNRLEKALKVAEHYLKKIAYHDRYGHILLPKPVLYETYAKRALNEIDFIMGVENDQEVRNGDDVSGLG